MLSATTSIHMKHAFFIIFQEGKTMPLKVTINWNNLGY